MKSLTVQEVADLWEIDSEVLLSKIVAEFDLKESYSVDTVLEDIREEYAFSPALIKDMAEEIKQGGLIKIIGTSAYKTLHVRNISMLHDWSGLIMGLLVLIHLALHWKWIVSMTKNMVFRKKK